jgi:tetratricopeptide (TPR) repeat protein
MSLAEVKRPQEAITNLNTYLNMISYNKAAYLSRGIIYMNTWKSDSAILDFNMCLKLDSTDADIYYNRAICYKKWEKYDKAEKDFTKVLEFRAGDIDVTCLLAESKYMLGDTTFAYDLLNQTAEKFKFLTLNGYFIRGTINLGYKKYGLAISDLSAVIDKNHAYTEAYVYRGLAYYCIGEFEKSKEDFTEAIKYDKNNITALYTRGLANIKLKTPDEAYSDLIKAESLGHPLAKRARLIYLKDFVPTK